MRDSKFVSAVREILAPALEAVGFVVVSTSADEVRFESPVVWASVFHEGRSGALGLQFDRRDQPNLRGAYLVSHAIALVDRAAAARALDPLVRTDDELRAALRGLRQDLETYCAAALRGDAETFEAMDAARRLYGRRYAEWTARAVKMGLSAAISAGDWIEWSRCTPPPSTTSTLQTLGASRLRVRTRARSGGSIRQIART